MNDPTGSDGFCVFLYCTVATILNLQQIVWVSYTHTHTHGKQKLMITKTSRRPSEEEDW